MQKPRLQPQICNQAMSCQSYMLYGKLCKDENQNQVNAVREFKDRKICMQTAER